MITHAPHLSRAARYPAMLATTEMELSFAAYQERQLHEISAAGLTARAQKLSRAGQFRFHGGRWTPEPYVGHAVVTMVETAAENAPLVEPLRDLQRALLEGFPDDGVLYPLPAGSFHQTIANTLSDEKHQRLVVDRGLSTGYPGIVTSTFGEFPSTFPGEPPTMRLVGVSLFRTAIGLLGIFNREEGFHRVLNFRDRFYNHPRVADLGIRRTRPFIGHITLAYVERELDVAARARLVEVVTSINRTLALRDLHFHLPVAELRAYDHLAEFKPLPGLPRYRL